jgi:hypothetical protein
MDVQAAAGLLPTFGRRVTAAHRARRVCLSVCLSAGGWRAVAAIRSDRRTFKAKLAACVCLSAGIPSPLRPCSGVAAGGCGGRGDARVGSCAIGGGEETGACTPSNHLSIRPFPILVSVCPPVCLPVCLSVCPSAPAWLPACLNVEVPALPSSIRTRAPLRAACPAHMVPCSNFTSPCVCHASAVCLSMHLSCICGLSVFLSLHLSRICGPFVRPCA